ncbi:hypothetical protein BVRB_032650 [Beta vulgaris subsp. vulgaris]|uniref:EF-hand domain-containing protein n=1 Tax=Beta vulgaris subsp. vulgaris TaxID=3555 RepID=A0A0J8B0A1_BETVV|nr:hypothetical protein BVRB_032650 [Beta vulgaris subsp. vulgaris]
MIDKITFRKVFDLPGILSERIFDAFDVDRVGAIDFDAFLRGLSCQLRGSPEHKVQRSKIPSSFSLGALDTPDLGI